MAARYGLAGPALHPNTGQELPATILARELLTQLRPALHTTGDLDEVEELITHSLAPPQRAPRTHPAHNDDTLDQDPSTAVNPGLRPDPPPLRR
jgi:carboxylate-amine ligase